MKYGKASKIVEDFLKENRLFGLILCYDVNDVARIDVDNFLISLVLYSDEAIKQNLQGNTLKSVLDLKRKMEVYKDKYTKVVEDKEVINLNLLCDFVDELSFKVETDVPDENIEEYKALKEEALTVKDMVVSEDLNKLAILKNEKVNAIEKNKASIRVFQDRINLLKNKGELNYDEVDALNDLENEVAKLEKENFSLAKNIEFIDELTKKAQNKEEDKSFADSFVDSIDINYYKMTKDVDEISRPAEINFMIHVAMMSKESIEKIENSVLKSKAKEVKKMLEDIRKEPEGVLEDSDEYQDYVKFIEAYLDDMVANREKKVDSVIEQFDKLVTTSKDALDSIKKDDLKTIKDKKKDIDGIQQKLNEKIDIISKEIEELESKGTLTKEEQERLNDLKKEVLDLNDHLDSNKKKLNDLDDTVEDLSGNKEETDPLEENGKIIKGVKKEKTQIVKKVKNRLDLLKKCVKKYWKGILIGAGIGVAAGFVIGPMGLVVLDIGAVLSKVVINRRVKKLEAGTLFNTEVLGLEEPSNILQKEIKKLKELTYDEEFLKELSVGLTSFIVASMATSMIKRTVTNAINNRVQAEGVSNVQATPEPTPEPTPSTVEPQVEVPVETAPTTSPYDGIKIGDNVGSYNVSTGHDTANWAVNNINSEGLISNYVNSGSVFKRFAVVNPDGTIGQIINTNGLSITEFAAQNGIDLSQIAVDVASKDGISQAWVSASELVSGVGKVL